MVSPHDTHAQWKDLEVSSSIESAMGHNRPNFLTISSLQEQLRE